MCLALNLAHRTSKLVGVVVAKQVCRPPQGGACGFTSRLPPRWLLRRFGTTRGPVNTCEPTRARLACGDGLNENMRSPAQRRAIGCQHAEADYNAPNSGISAASILRGRHFAAWRDFSPGVANNNLTGAVP